jgi:rhodanese-related sulfurtransferase
VYCYHGTMSRDFAQLVHNLGFEHVYHLEGGYHSWSQLAGA